MLLWRLQGRRHPLTCPDPSCTQLLTTEGVQQLLQDDEVLSEVGGLTVQLIMGAGHLASYPVTH